MSIANQRASSDYQEAVKATEEIEPPALGFIRPSDYKTGTTSLSTAIIKQNNTLIYLLTKQAQKLGEFEEEVRKLRHSIEVLGKREAGPISREFRRELALNSGNGGQLPGWAGPNAIN